MTRPLRIEFKGAVYHITSRGNTIQMIFLDIKKLGGDIKSDISRPDPLISSLIEAIHWNGLPRLTGMLTKGTKREM